MQTLTSQPEVTIGLIPATQAARITLLAMSHSLDGTAYGPGRYELQALSGGGIKLTDQDGRTEIVNGELQLKPEPSTQAEAAFIVHDITIGVSFHWQQQEDQQFQGSLRVKHFESAGVAQLAILNCLRVEDYLTSVIASEMSATAHPELLKAHAIISRSWLLAQLPNWKPKVVVQAHANPANDPANSAATDDEHLRWYDRENHDLFDICADDHCQRYQGIAKVSTERVSAAIQATRGSVLSYQDELCDARFSKSCGGFTELFSTAWQDLDLPYLQAFYDGDVFPAEYALPLTEEANAASWIRQTPPAHCQTTDGAVLQRILPSFDQATTDFYRWRVTIAQVELQDLLRQKLGLSVGAIRALEPVLRGASGRLLKLRIVGTERTIVIGKELEIRRALSRSHLYSSAFVVEPGELCDGVPDSFTLIGAGWGHGVGLCQIGAALMAEKGATSEQILTHYYRGASLLKLYR